MAYTFNVNLTPNTGATAFYLLLQTLVSAGWSVVSSGDGLSAYSSSGNILTGNIFQINVTNGGSGYTSAPTVSITGGGGSGATAVASVQGGAVVSVAVITRGSGFTSQPTIAFSGGGGSNAQAVALFGAQTGATGFGNTHAWFRIRQPGSQSREFIIQNGQGASNYQNWRIKYTPGLHGGFNQLPSGGGSAGASVTPSALDEAYITTASGTDASPIFQTIFNNDGVYRLHVAAGAATENNTFYLLALNAGGLTPSTCLLLDVMQAGSYPSSDLDPAIVYLDTFSSNILGPNLRDGTPNGFSGAINGASPPSSYFGSNWVNISARTIAGFTNGQGTNSWSAKGDVLPYPWNRNGFPLDFKGWGTMLYQASQGGSSSLDVMSVVNTGDRLQIYGTLLPWNGSNPII